MISALLIATLAVAAQGSYVPTSYWPSHSAGWNSWNNGWNDHQVAAYPYAKSWTSSSWPATNLYSNGWDGAYGGVQKAWGQPWGTYGAGWSYQNIAKTIAPSVKVNSWSQPWGTYGAADWGYQNVAKTIVPSVNINSWSQPWETYGAADWGYQQNVAKTIVPAGNSWGIPWGSYGAGTYGWEQPQVIKTVVPAAKQVAPATVGVGKVLLH